ncbi:MAG: RagB/SusD family nutrient uptake outer membrane protein, partial [Duncaniella sp.]|nr:RagB/SusD family nutrient uptake outer membrane protein [Duncaniella sp.]
AEARVLRALGYYFMIDLFGKGPWVLDSPVGAVPPTYDRQQLFDGTVAELVDVIGSGHLRPAAQQAYGRVSREAARMLLAKLYLNAKVYVGTPMYDKCAEQCLEITKTITSLAPTYKYLFCASNDKYVGNGEILWALPQQSGMMETWGGTTYLTAGAFIESAPDEVLAKLGTSSSMVWSGVRMRPELSTAFEPGDKRALYYAGDFKVGVQDLDNYDAESDGYMCIKYTYTTEDDYENTAGIVSPAMCNADYPLFRLADTYLMLAECQLNGVDCNGKQYFDAVRTRAGLPVTGLTPESLLHERQTELYWEGFRRSDLIRFGKYTGSTYNWSWKGGVYEGVAIDDTRAIFAIPYQYVATVGQNPGY